MDTVVVGIYEVLNESNLKILNITLRRNIKITMNRPRTTPLKELHTENEITTSDSCLSKNPYVLFIKRKFTYISTIMTNMNRFMAHNKSTALRKNLIWSQMNLVNIVIKLRCQRKLRLKG